MASRKAPRYTEIPLEAIQSDNNTPHHPHHQPNSPLLQPSPNPDLSPSPSKSNHGNSKPHTKAQTLPTPRGRGRIFGWWWELAAIAISLICTALIISILFSMSDQPLSKWHLPIQPNSLVAVFSTVARSALLFPLAECIGQLKWMYFEEKPRTLSSIETFDAAGKGPWGSVLFLWKIRGRSVLGVVGAAVVVLLLGFEAFTQQVIAFGSRGAVVKAGEGTGAVTRITRNFGNLKDEGRSRTRDWTNLQHSLFTGTLGVLAEAGMQPQSLNTGCPSGHCTFPDFTALAVCARCEDEPVRMDDLACNGTFYKFGEQVDWFENFADLRRRLEDAPTTNVTQIKMMCIKSYGTEGLYPAPPLPLFFDFQLDDSEVKDGVITSGIVGMKVSFMQGGTEDKYVEELFESRNSTHRTKLDEAVSPSIRGCSSVFDENEPLPFWLDGWELPSTMLSTFTCLNSTTDIMRWDSLSHLGEINGTFSKCSLNYCAKHHSKVSWTSNSLHSETTDFLLREIGNTSDPRTPVATENEDETAIFSPLAGQIIPGEAQGGGNFTIGRENLAILPGVLQASDAAAQWNIYFANYVQNINGDFASLFEKFADIYTSTFRNKQNPDSYELKGEILGTEVYVQVRWGWFAGPLAVILAALVFIGVTVWKSRGKGYLFKSHVLPVVFYGVDKGELKGLKGDEYVSSGSGGGEADGVQQTLYHGDVGKVAEGIRVRFRRGEDGDLGLKRE